MIDKIIQIEGLFMLKIKGMGRINEISISKIRKITAIR